MPFQVEISNELNSATLLVPCTVCSNPKLHFFLFDLQVLSKEKDLESIFKRFLLF